MAALIDDVRSGDLCAGKPVLFLHTGGAPAVFGYVNDLLPLLEQD
jgi:1-aminocyclopropane-1-carboxylate deaminase/D-cysteine desulfhydrase-like pyridoxal-dependent ACC family enzyme